MYPLLFPLEDEREKAITDKACRTTFVSLWFVLPCAVGFLTFRLLLMNIFLDTHYIFYFLFSFIQMTVFHVSLYRIISLKETFLHRQEGFFKLILVHIAILFYHFI